MPTSPARHLYTVGKSAYTGAAIDPLTLGGRGEACNGGHQFPFASYPFDEGQGFNPSQLDQVKNLDMILVFLATCRF